MRALIVDDQLNVRRFFKEILLDDGTFADVAEAADGIAAQEVLLAEDFDLAIVDIDLPGKDGLALIAEVKRRKPRQSFLIFSGMPIADYAEAAAMLGVRGVLPKGCLPATILAGARRAVGS